MQGDDTEPKHGIRSRCKPIRHPESTPGKGSNGCSRHPTGASENRICPLAAVVDNLAAREIDHHLKLIAQTNRLAKLSYEITPPPRIYMYFMAACCHRPDRLQPHHAAAESYPGRQTKPPAKPPFAANQQPHPGAAGYGQRHRIHRSRAGCKDLCHLLGRTGPPLSNRSAT